MSVVVRGVKNAFRNSVRTFSIVIILALSIGLALTMLVARQAVSNKIAQVKSSVGNTITVSPAGSRGFEGGGNPLTAAQISDITATAHVTNVTQILQDRLSSTDTNLVSGIDAGSLGRRFGGGQGGPNGDSTSTDNSGSTTTPTTFTVPVTVIGTNNATSSSSLGQGGGTVSITSGTAFDGTKDADVAVLGTAIATKNSLSVGSTFTAYGATITVVAIYDAGNTFANNTVIMPLATVQRLSSQTGDVTSATVTVDSITNLASTASALTSTLGSAADVVSSQDATADTISSLQNVESISLFSLIGAVVAGAVIILLTMLMIVRERRREIGVLKAIGASNVKVMAQFIYESITLTLMGAVVGLGVGVVAANPVTNLLVKNSATTTTSTTTGAAGGGRGFGGGAEAAGRSVTRSFGAAGRSLSNIHAAVGWSILLYGLLAAIIIAVIGSAIPALLISKIRPAEVMRAE